MDSDKLAHELASEGCRHCIGSMAYYQLLDGYKLMFQAIERRTGKLIKFEKAVS